MARACLMLRFWSEDIPHIQCTDTEWRKLKELFERKFDQGNIQSDVEEFLELHLDNLRKEGEK